MHEQIVTKVAELRQRDAMYQAKYGQDYPTLHNVLPQMKHSSGTSKRR
jgi:hypothetical protein